MNFHLVPQDKANHQVYGARTSAVTSAIALSFGSPIWLAVLIAVASAFLLGWIGEEVQKRTNAQARAVGEVEPHSIEAGDIWATGYGGLAVALPLAMMLLFSFARG